MSPASIIIPAHDEARVLARCLGTLLDRAEPHEFDVVVVANGCRDNTAQIARSYPGVTCIETAEASKAAALNLGDRHAESFPRVYLDADIEVGTEAIRALVDCLQRDEALAAAPRVRFDVAAASWAARQHSAVLQTLPVFQRNYVGSGCYALSAPGRARFETFPPLIADDRFVDSLFAQREKRTLDQEMVARCPRTWRAIVHRSVRVKAGALELRRFYGEASTIHLLAERPCAAATVGEATLTPRDTKSHLLRLLRSPRWVLPVAVFVATQAVISVLARTRARLGLGGRWLRDETSR